MSNRSFVGRRGVRVAGVATMVLSSVLAAGTAAFTGAASAGAAPSQITQYSETFTYIGTVQTATIPLGVQSVHITADGASGGGAGSTDGGTPGAGGQVSAAVPISGLTSFSLYVGEAGGNAQPGLPGTGGTSSGALTGGGNGGLADPFGTSQSGGGGGGATVVDLGDTPLLVAGGGGGAGGASIDALGNVGDGGSGGNGGATAATGTYGQGPFGGPGGPGGGAATDTGQSADGAIPATTGGGGGGGGGGYTRGGNAGAPGFGDVGGGGGGGAGDSYASTTVDDVTTGTAPGGNGSVTISWSLPVVRLLTSAASIALHAKMKLTARVEGLGTPVPTGSVSFYDTANKTTTLLGTAALTLVGKVPEATLTTTALPAGLNGLHVTYGGDSNYPAARSQSSIVMVTDPKAKATPVAVKFGPTPLGFTALREVVVTSTGLTGLLVKSIAWSAEPGSNGFSMQQTNCFGRTFAPGESCTILFGFDPQTTGPAWGTADIMTSASSKPLAVTLSGTGD